MSGQAYTDDSAFELPYSLRSSGPAESEVILPREPTQQFIAGLLVFLAVGLALVAPAAVYVESEPWHELMLVVGGALITASALGATVDAWFKKRLVRDAFVAAFGYLLPEILRGEMGWIYSLGVVCRTFNEDVTITVEDSFVVCRFRIEREFENCVRKTMRGEDEGVYGALQDFAVDEWHRGRRQSQITSMGYVKEGKTSTEFDVTRTDNNVVGSLRDTLVLGAGETVRTWVEAEEIKNLSDDLTVFVRVATKDPRVRIEAPDELGLSVVIASRDALPESEMGHKTWWHKGVLLPYQAVRVEWRHRQDQGVSDSN